jgi:Zn-dependent peptidase ImmA (M78 family)
MEKIAINTERLQFCCDMLSIDINKLYQDINITENTFKKAISGGRALSIKQLEKISKYFNRSLLFFVNSNPINEELVYSVQFRTINNQKPIHSKQINAFIENAEQHRRIYLNLLQELGVPIPRNWKNDLNIDNFNIVKSANIVREWLGLKENLNFEKIRELVEQKGFVVIVRSGFTGKWKIDKDNCIRGFALYYDTLPVIVVKKQVSKGAQAFTLMHELAHILIHKDSMLDENEDFYSYTGKEKEANEFASNILMPQNLINNIDYYQSYKSFKENQYKERERKIQAGKEAGKEIIIPRKYSHREPINIFGKIYVATVLDAMQNKNITLNKAGSYLDNLKIKTLHKLEGEFV